MPYSRSCWGNFVGLRPTHLRFLRRPTQSFRGREAGAFLGNWAREATCSPNMGSNLQCFIRFLNLICRRCSGKLGRGD